MSKKIILIVDDELSPRLFMKRTLEKDYTILEAHDGEEALQIARMRKPDLILMDIMMPKVDGYTACSTIKSDPELSAVPVVMVTGLGFRLNQALATRVGADSYLTKPFTVEELKSTVIKYLGAE